MTSLDLWPIGNCQVSALIDRDGAFVWGCVPRVDGDPIDRLFAARDAMTEALEAAGSSADGARRMLRLAIADDLRAAARVRGDEG